ncbi:hypothetical protein GY45DRAFT_1358763 [Cubamyces sp. BRFM 1775]|nr:hypothetical protein GY45DRAFT_1358763 [Cubamyces sp. BRFM 1775]
MTQITDPPGSEVHGSQHIKQNESRTTSRTDVRATADHTEDLSSGSAAHGVDAAGEEDAVEQCLMVDSHRETHRAIISQLGQSSADSTQLATATCPGTLGCSSGAPHPPDSVFDSPETPNPSTGIAIVEPPSLHDRHFPECDRPQAPSDKEDTMNAEAYTPPISTRGESHGIVQERRMDGPCSPSVEQDMHVSSAPSTPTNCPIAPGFIVSAYLSEQPQNVDDIPCSSLATAGYHQEQGPHEERTTTLEDTAGCAAVIDTSALVTEGEPRVPSQQDDDAIPPVSPDPEAGRVILDVSGQLVVATVDSHSESECLGLGSTCLDNLLDPPTQLTESLGPLMENLANSLADCASPQQHSVISQCALSMPTVSDDVPLLADAKDTSTSGVTLREAFIAELENRPEDCHEEAPGAEAALVEDCNDLSSVVSCEAAITPDPMPSILVNTDALVTLDADPADAQDEPASVPEVHSSSSLPSVESGLLLDGTTASLPENCDGLLLHTSPPSEPCVISIGESMRTPDRLLLPDSRAPFSAAATATDQSAARADCLALERMEADCGDNEASDDKLSLVDTFESEGAAYDLPPSSPPPSSSPLPIFSSPPRDRSSTPPSSSPPLPFSEDKSLSFEELEEDSVSITAAKHGASADIEQSGDSCAADLSSHVEIDPLEEEQSAKRMKLESTPISTIGSSDAPVPKRPTQASVAKQHKKLAAPFRSPMIKGPLVQGGLHAVYATGRAFAPPPPRKTRTDYVAEPVAADKPDSALANRDRTANAAKQFKSPLVLSDAIAGSSSSSASGLSAVKATPTIQSLQGKLQTLKQAIKIKKSGNGQEEDELEHLVRKWTTVGREVAWAVWDYVKDLDPGAGYAVGQKSGGWSSGEGDDHWGAQTGQKRAFDPSWGYDDDHVAKKRRLESGGDVEMDDEEAAPTVQHTLGTMLRHLSIDPATLGWDEEEGDFVDA